MDDSNPADKKFQKELNSGTVALVLLGVLDRARQPMYGYQIAKQVEAVKNLNIDKITVWDSGNAEKGGSSTANFLSSMIRALPPLHDVAEMAGLDLPDYLGQMQQPKAVTKRASAAPEKTKATDHPGENTT